MTIGLGLLVLSTALAVSAEEIPGEPRLYLFCAAAADLAGRRDLLVRTNRRRQGTGVHVRDLPRRIQGSCPRVDHAVRALAQSSLRT